MVGIAGIGAYVPVYRLSSETFGNAWGQAGGGGERAVANHDEDAITMAVEATLNCLKGTDPKTIDGLYFASTTAPYAEKQNSTLISVVCDLRSDIFTADFASSLRAGTSALRAAVDAVRAGSARKVVVAATDVRLTMPGDETETTLGDGAAALLVGNDGAIADIELQHSLSYELTDVWRRKGDPYLQVADARFVQIYGYERAMKEAVEGLLKKAELRREEIARVVYYAPDIRNFRNLARPLGFKPEAYLDGSLLTKVGNTGTANSMLSLVAALEAAKPGERVILVGYGNGADAFLLRVTDKIEEWREKSGLKASLANKRPLTNYGKYLRFRKLVTTEEVTPYSSEILTWREQKYNAPLYAQRCRQCGAVQFPTRRVCWQCRVRDDFEDFRLGRHGTVITFTKDTLVPTPDPPVIMASADLEGGGRLYTQVTDCDPGEIKIGMPVEVTFRKFHEGLGFCNYFWKYRPVRA